MTRRREDPPADHRVFFSIECRDRSCRKGEYGEFLSGLLATLIEGTGAIGGLWSCVISESSERLQHGTFAVRRYPGCKGC
jgi:hypothetical protein